MGHIYGGHVCLAGRQGTLSVPLSPEDKQEKVHTSFLRRIAGMGKAVPKASLYKESGRYPLMLQWLLLAAMFWNKMADRRESALIHMAYKDNVELTLRRKKCWTWHFLKAMSAIGAIKNAAAIKVQGRRTLQEMCRTCLSRLWNCILKEEMLESKACMFLD